MPVDAPRRSVAATVEDEVARALRDHARVVLAVSGGRDSMVLLEAAAAVAPGRIAAVATFDHGTGAAATAGCELAARRARALGLRVERGRAEGVPRGEAAWREARWCFLRAAAARHGAAVATAHTEDDQVETVLMRALRGAGARGLAGLYAPMPPLVAEHRAVARPLLALRRDAIAAYAAERGVRWVEDPSNLSRRFLRNRVRLDLLPALESARPGLSAELLDVARRAAEWRAEVDEWIARNVDARVEGEALTVAGVDLRGYDARWLAVVWPALAARVGLALDRRGTDRLAEFTIYGAAGARIQLSGGFEVIRHRGSLHLRRMGRRAANGAGKGTEPQAVEAVARHAQPLSEVLVFGEWRFRRVPGETAASEWIAPLPGDVPLTVRAWRPGDRMVPHGAAAARRVKGLFRDAGVDAARRIGWPVVVAGDEIVWIPGVRRSGAAAERSGRPTVTILCERIPERADH